MLLREKFPHLEPYYSELNETPFHVKEYISTEKLHWILCDRGHTAQKITLEFIRHPGCVSCMQRSDLFQDEDYLAFRYPSIASEFHESNTIRPEDILPDSTLTAEWNDGVKERVRDRVKRYINEGKVERNHLSKKHLVARRKQNIDPYLEGEVKRNSPPPQPKLKEAFPEILEKCVNPEVAGEYRIKSNKKIQWICEEGHIFTSSIKDTLKRTSFCVVCSGLELFVGVNDFRTTHPVAASYIASPDPSSITLAYSGRVTWKCRDCFREWETLLERHLYTKDRRPGCPYCSSSAEEREVSDFVSRLGFVTRNNDKHVINPYELDIYIEDQKKAIEFNGVYWHSEQRRPDRNVHLSKLMRCQSKGIELLQVWEDDWKVRRSAVECLVEDFVLGTAKKISGSLSSCILEESDEFLVMFSLYPGRAPDLRVGVFDSELLVSVISLIETDSNGFEIVDYCFRPGYRDSIKAFVDNACSLGFSRGDKIIVKSDNCYSDGSEFERAGFLYKGLLEPDFKVLIQHDLRCDKELCEDPFSENVNRVWDAGYLLWELVV